jgi:hypothetical protein
MEAVAAATLDFDAPDETRELDNARVEVISTPQGNVARMTLQPGWTWASSVKPVAGTESCEAAHLGYAVSGRIRIIPDDGEPVEFTAPGVYVLAPGHHAEVVGDEPVVVYEFESNTAANYAQGEAA